MSRRPNRAEPDAAFSGEHARVRAVPWHGQTGCYSGGGTIEKYKWLAS